MQPRYIKAMWIVAVALIFALQTFAIFVSHQSREFMYFLSFVIGALASCTTLVHNKIKFGLWFPGVRKK